MALSSSQFRAAAVRPSAIIWDISPRILRPIGILLLLVLTVSVSLLVSATPVAAVDEEDLPPPVAARTDAPSVAEFKIESVETRVGEDRASGPEGLLERAAEKDLYATPYATFSEPATDISIHTALSFRFDSSTGINPSALRQSFQIEPATPGALSWEDDGRLVFTPDQPLLPGTAYEASFDGRREDPLTGQQQQLLQGQSRFYFETRPAASATGIDPVGGARDVLPPYVVIDFDQPMDIDAVNAAFAMHDPVLGGLRLGYLTWDETAQELTYTPDVPFEKGRTLTVELREGSVDAEGNPLLGEWNFSTPPAPVVAAPAPVVAPAPAMQAPAPIAVAPSGNLAGYALNQINAARAAYGFAPLYLDAGLTAQAQAHANDQVARGYFAHGAGQENQCHYYSSDSGWVLNWCHAQFMAEPYPGYPNHKGNLLSPNYTRVGIGISTGGGRTVITWDFG